MTKSEFSAPPDRNNFLKNKSFKDFTSTDSLLLVKTANGILKRLSPSLDTSLRGKIQSSISQLFSIYHLSGVNARGQYNSKNQNYELLTSSVGLENIVDNNSSVYNNKENNFYKKFWNLHKYICNPLLLFNSSGSSEEIANIDCLDEFDFEKSEVNKIDDKSNTEINVNINNNNLNKFSSSNNKSYNTLNVFVNSLNSLVSYFCRNSVNIQSLKAIKNINIKIEAVFSYPKFLLSPQLFDLQVKDPSFRVIIISQIIICLNAFIKPINSIQIKSFVTNDSQKANINNLIVKSFEYLNQLSKEYCEIFKSNLNDETFFENWKLNIGKENLEKQTLIPHNNKDHLN